MLSARTRWSGRMIMVSFFLHWPWSIVNGTLRKRSLAKIHGWDGYWIEHMHSLRSSIAHEWRYGCHPYRVSLFGFSFDCFAPLHLDREHSHGLQFAPRFMILLPLLFEMWMSTGWFSIYLFCSEPFFVPAVDGFDVRVPSPGIKFCNKGELRTYYPQR